MSHRYEYRFSIDVFRPETLPLVRLIEYLSDLAILLGNRDEVHFLRVEEGSAQLVSIIDPPAQPKVRERVSSVRAGHGPADALKAFRNLDERLASDNATARLSEDSTSILEFPGRNRRPPPTFGPFSEIGSLNGVVIAVGGQRDFVPVHLQDGERVFNCSATRELARRIAHHLFSEPVRVFGTGRWLRDEDGEWQLRGFRISEFALLEDIDLSEGVERLRRAHRLSDWATLEDPIAELDDIRGGGEG